MTLASLGAIWISGCLFLAGLESSEWTYGRLFDVVIEDLKNAPEGSQSEHSNHKRYSLIETGSNYLFLKRLLEYPERWTPGLGFLVAAAVGAIGLKAQKRENRKK